MFDVGGGELMLILLVAFILFGPSQISEVSKKIGKFTAQAKKMKREFKRQIDDIDNDID